jgi:hypothetical protein
MSERGQAIMIWWALLFMVVWGVAYFFLIGFWPPPPATDTPAQVAALYAAHPERIEIGAFIGSATGGFMVPLAVVIAIQIDRLGREMRPWAILQLGGGFMMSIFLALPPLFWGIAAFTPGRPPDVTALMNETAFLTTVTTIQYFVFQDLAIAYVCFTARPDPRSPFPRWFGYLSIVEFLLTEVGAAGFLTKTGPFAWNGFFVFWVPITIFGIWVIALSIHLLRALKFQRGLNTTQ